MGGQIGYNRQFRSHWVIGVEGDISGTGTSNTTLCRSLSVAFRLGPGSLIRPSAISDGVATARGRLGYAADRWLVYVTGGGAWGEAGRAPPGSNFGGLWSPVTSSYQLGWTLGGGVEYGFTNNWTARAEYLYYDLGGTTIVNVGTSPFVNNQVWDRNKINVVRVGVNYKF